MLGDSHVAIKQDVERSAKSKFTFPTETFHLVRKLVVEVSVQTRIPSSSRQDSQTRPLGDWSLHTVNAFGLLSLQQFAPALERSSRLVERHLDVSTST